MEQIVEHYNIREITLKSGKTSWEAEIIKKNMVPIVREKFRELLNDVLGKRERNTLRLEHRNNTRIK